MTDAAEDAGVTLAVAYHLRWHAGHRLIAVMAEAGDLGDLRHMRVPVGLARPRRLPTGELTPRWVAGGVWPAWGPTAWT